MYKQTMLQWFNVKIPSVTLSREARGGAFMAKSIISDTINTLILTSKVGIRTLLV
nr:MAG TPA: hypothetical protein [Caudoviricetes sp.]